MTTKVSELEKLENLILGYKNESDMKKKHVLYLGLVQESMRLVKKIVSGVYPLPLTTSKDDLIQVGAVGVLKAIETYEVERKGSFKTYATKFIKGRILHYLRDKANIVRPPRETIENLNKVKEALKELSDGRVESVTTTEVAEYIHMPKEKVEEILNIELLKNMVSLDQNIYSTDGVETLLDRIQEENSESFEEIYENKKMIEFALSKLPEPDKTIVAQYYLHGIKRKDLAQNFNVSPTQISRILKRALHKLYLIIENETVQKEDR